ncbi:MAG: hypothetical protein AAB330_00415 [Bacteroidota bacterium]
MNAPATTPDTSIKILLIVFAALLLGQCIFLGVILLIHSQGFQLIEEGAEIFQYVAVALTLTAIGVSTFLYRNMMNQAHALSPRPDPIATYRTATIIRLAILEGGNMVNLVFYLLTEKEIFLGLFAAIIAAFFLARPASDKIASDS